MPVFLYHGNPDDLVEFSTREKAEEAIAQEVRDQQSEHSSLTVIEGTKLDIKFGARLEG